MAAGWAPFWRYLGLGRYGEQLRNLYTVFPREQVHVLRYKELVDEPHRHAQPHLRVPRDRPPTSSPRCPPQNVSTYVEPTRPRPACSRPRLRAGAAVGQVLPARGLAHDQHAAASGPASTQQRNRPELTPEDRRTLVASFADDIRLLEQQTGGSYEDWLGHRDGGTYSVRRSWAPSARVAS